MEQMLMNGENLIKKYTGFKGRHSTCTISVTNRRLIMTNKNHSFLNKMEYSKEISINEVNSITTKYCKKMSLYGLIFFLGIALVVFLMFKNSKPLVGFMGAPIIVVLGIVLLNVFAPKAGTVLISTSTLDCVRIGVSLDFRNSKNIKRVRMTNAKLGKDFVSLCEELGAIIKSVQAGEQVDYNR